MKQKSYGNCECGAKLYHHRAKQCGQCAVKAHAGSSQCPFCLSWYMTHPPRSVAEVAYHASGKCR